MKSKAFFFSLISYFLSCFPTILKKSTKIFKNFSGKQFSRFSKVCQFFRRSLVASSIFAVRKPAAKSNLNRKSNSKLLFKQGIIKIFKYYEEENCLQTSGFTEEETQSQLFFLKYFIDIRNTHYSKNSKQAILKKCSFEKSST